MAASDRSLAVLRLFSIERPEWTAEGIVTELGVSIATAYRYLSALDEAGLIATTRVGYYGLGPTIIQLDRQLQLTDPLLAAANPVMTELATYAPPGSAVLLCRPMGSSVLCIHQVLSAGLQSRVSYERGRPMPLFYGATSKILLAYQSVRAVKVLFETYQDELLRAGLGATLEEFRATLSEWRRAGAVVTYHEVDQGRIGIAAPILIEEKTAIGSLSYVVPETIDRRSVVRLTTWAVSGAREIETLLRGDTASRQVTA